MGFYTRDFLMQMPCFDLSKEAQIFKKTQLIFMFTLMCQQLREGYLIFYESHFYSFILYLLISQLFRYQNFLYLLLIMIALKTNQQGSIVLLITLNSFSFFHLKCFYYLLKVLFFVLNSCFNLYYMKCFLYCQKKILQNHHDRFNQVDLNSCQKWNQFMLHQDFATLILLWNSFKCWIKHLNYLQLITLIHQSIFQLLRTQTFKIDHFYCFQLYFFNLTTKIVPISFDISFVGWWVLDRSSSFIKFSFNQAISNYYVHTQYYFLLFLVQINHADFSLQSQGSGFFKISSEFNIPKKNFFMINFGINIVSFMNLSLYSIYGENQVILEYFLFS
ncbi:transmembrane protein, putative (macronuclear) [Tetrahymena thermophila SB210]|uniref:Transmembrane protein, putative n=1 Tax=Tetrahymena thermophila (strain SB210) TaxID=312017 RepID=W7X8N0_TETTS|nr:transmembrane protein, putative [Tetrahymena thermophila SB210]EWS73707.1 transmembrane protein, putative [Tetrahymena thermophila SB210]|eukprot:XP_012653745.1 transmembrane protein, putative [Tetrahymena thermophila SB210]